LVNASDRKVKKLLVHPGRNFERAGRLLVPLQSDWTVRGRALALIGEKYGYEKVGWAQMTDNALIATSPSRTGIIV
jgi:hypothetical protein